MFGYILHIEAIIKKMEIVSINILPQQNDIPRVNSSDTLLY